MLFDIPLVNKVLDVYFKKCSSADLAKKSVAFGVMTSCFLVAIKCIAWLLTNSLSMQASMSDSILDALSSFLAYHALKFSSVKFDEDHNYGHGKVEGIMALFQCLVVVYSGIMIFKEAYESFYDPHPIANSGIGIVIMVLSCVAVYQLLYFQRYVAVKTDCLLVKGDSLHYASDFFMNICIILSLVLSSFFAYVDVICGLIVGCYVLYNAISIIRNALIDLMDEALPDNVRNDILNTIKSTNGVVDVLILRTRSAGMKKYVDARVSVDRNLSIVDADKIANSVEQAISNMFEKVDVIIKVEPK